MEEQKNNIATVEAPVNHANETSSVDAAPKKKKVTRSRSKKVVAPVDEPKEVQSENNEEVKPQVENHKATKNKAQDNKHAEKSAAAQDGASVEPGNKATDDKAPEQKAQVVDQAQKAPEQKAQVVDQAQKAPEQKAQVVDQAQKAPEQKAQAVDQAQKAPEQKTPAPEPKPNFAEAKPKAIPRMPQNLLIRDFCDLANSSGRIPLLTDQQIQQLPYEEAFNRYMILEAIISNVLDYDIVLSDTNIWLELLVGHTSSHSDPRVNARLMFERQLEFISRMAKKIGGKFMIMSETYEEVDRFATMQEPTDYKVADWKDEVLCRNVAARLAKRLMLSQQKENRLRIEGIGSESHHAAFADPAIIRRTVELFAQGKRVLLLTNDASVGIRSLGMCDDLQRVNNVSDKVWREVYEPQRPMVLTMDDLKLLDQFTRQYHFLQVAANRQWMQDVTMREPAVIEKPLELWLEGFRPGDRHERRSDKLEQQRREQQERQRQEQERQRQEQERKEQQRLEEERRAAEKQARREEQERREQENRERREQARLEQQRREEQRRADRERAAAEKAARLAAEEEKRQEQAANVAENEQNAETTTAAESAPANQPEVQEMPVAQPEAAEAPAQGAASENQPVAPEGDAPNAPVSEAAPISLPPLSPEMMELMNPSSSKKKPTRRGGRRRKQSDGAE